MRRQHNILIGERSAERIKIEVGSALPERKSSTGFRYMAWPYDRYPKEITVSYSEMAHALDKSISKVEEAILKARNDATWIVSGYLPHRNLSDRWRSFAQRTRSAYRDETKLPVHVAEDPLRCSCKRNRNRAEKYRQVLSFLSLIRRFAYSSISQPEKSTRIEMLWFKFWSKRSRKSIQHSYPEFIRWFVSKPSIVNDAYPVSFLWKYNFFIFFLVLEAFSGYLIVQNNSFSENQALSILPILLPPKSTPW